MLKFINPIVAQAVVFGRATIRPVIARHVLLLLELVALAALALNTMKMNAAVRVEPTMVMKQTVQQ